MKRLIIAALAGTLLVGCGGKDRTISISFEDASATPEASATPLPYVQYAQDFITGITWYKRGDEVQYSSGSLSNADRANYDQAKDWIFSLCMQTGQFPDAKWRAVFENACDELGPITPIQLQGIGVDNRFQTTVYDGATYILKQALNNGP